SMTPFASSADGSGNALKWDPSSSGSASSNKPSRAIGSETLPTALTLITTDEFDLLGRQRLHTDARTHQHYTAYEAIGDGCSTLERTINIPYWSGTAAHLPIRVSELDHTGKLHAVFTLAPSISLTMGTGSASGPVALPSTTLIYQSLTLYSYDPKDGTLTFVD